MKLYLKELSTEEVIGIYGTNKDKLPERMRFLHPDAAQSYLRMSLEKKIKCSDMLRTYQGSLNAYIKKGAHRPGYSGHNFGFSIDIDVRWVIENNSFKDKTYLDRWMSGQGWYCHNPIGETRSRESWHYNYFGEESAAYLIHRTSDKRTWSRPVEQKIKDVYSYSWENLTTKDVQEKLTGLSMYSGDIDDNLGPLTTEGIKSFQRAWRLTADGIAGSVFNRTLACITSERIVIGDVC